MYHRSMPEALNSGTSESFPSALAHTMEYFLSGWITHCLGGLVNGEKKKSQRLKSPCCTLVREATQRNSEMPGLLQMFWVCPATSWSKCTWKAAAWFAVQNTLIISFFFAANIKKQSFKLTLSMSRLKRRQKKYAISQFLLLKHVIWTSAILRWRLRRGTKKLCQLQIFPFLNRGGFPPGDN